jgi:hypothetical protein
MCTSSSMFFTHARIAQRLSWLSSTSEALWMSQWSMRCDGQLKTVMWAWSCQ